MTLMWREAQRQGSFAEQSMVSGSGCNRRLEQIAGLIDWNALERELTEVYAAGEGRPAYRPLLMFKALLLQQWYQLSDPGLEEALLDRLSFRRFVGLRLEEAVPDHSTLSRFRAQLAARALSERLFKAINAQLEAKGLILKRGTILDATVVAAAVTPPPPNQGRAGVSPGDPDARWTTHKAGNGSRSYHFGYKAHLGVDLGSGLVRTALLTSANTNDTVVGDRLIGGDEQCVYADKAYDSAARRQLLARLGIADGIMRRAWWGTGRDPDPQLVARNQALAKVRFAVERNFAIMKRWYGFRRVRYRGLPRSSAQLFLVCVALNLRRALVLAGA
jgi:transposase, IS5 family